MEQHKWKHNCQLSRSGYGSTIALLYVAPEKLKGSPSFKILLAKSKTTLIMGLNALNGEHENRLRQQSP
jgi:hypothetical protein